MHYDNKVLTSSQHCRTLEEFWTISRTCLNKTFLFYSSDRGSKNKKNGNDKSDGKQISITFLKNYVRIKIEILAVHLIEPTSDELSAEEKLIWEPRPVKTSVAHILLPNISTSYVTDLHLLTIAICLAVIYTLSCNFVFSPFLVAAEHRFIINF